MQKKRGVKDYEISYWSKRGLENYKKYFLQYFSHYIGAKEDNSKIKILDVGCGVGIFSKILSDKGFKVFGIDYSEDIINIAKKRPGNENIKFQVGNVYNLQFPDNFFDIVICSGVFQCISNSQKAILEIKRVLKPEGTVIIMTLNVFSLTKFFQKEELKRYNSYWLKKKMAEKGFYKTKIKGIYFFPTFLDFLVDFLLKFKICDFLNLFFPIFIFFSHSFYIEGKKSNMNSEKINKDRRQLTYWHSGRVCENKEWERALKHFRDPQQEKALFLRRLRQLGADGWSRDLRVVELFCGRGNGLLAIEEIGFKHIEGVDLSASLLSQYQGSARLYVGDCRELKFKDRSKDLIIIQDGLHHLRTIPEDIEKVLSESYRALKPNGRIIIVEPWLTLFRRSVLFACKIRILGWLWPKFNSYISMVELEGKSYRNWLYHGSSVLKILDKYFICLSRRIRWGKFMYIGEKR